MAHDDGVLKPRRRMLGDRSRAGQTMAPSQTVVSQGAQLSQAERMARKSIRSPELVEALRHLDAAPSAIAQQEIIDWLRQAYDARGGGPLVGLFGHCYLGAPYIDHAFDLTGAIREHYTPSHAVPPMYVAARPFAVSEAYAYIEIYADGQVIPVRPDGSPAV